MKLTPEQLKRIDDIGRSIEKADYVSALRKAEAFYRENPRHVAARERYATMLADAALYTKLPGRERMKAKAIRILRELLRSLRGVPFGVRGSIRNEYYYHTGQYLKQYRLGIELVRKGDKSSYFSQGVGASWYAFELMHKGQVARGRRWAEVSVLAWGRHLKFEANYYYPYVNLAFAHGILGRLDEMEKHLVTAARLAKKSRKHHEFKKVRDLIASLPSS